MLAHEISVGSDAAYGIARRQQSGGAQLIGDTPEVEMFQAALGEILPLGDSLGRQMALHHCAVDSSNTQIYRQGYSHGSTPYDNHLVTLFQCNLPRGIHDAAECSQT